MSCSSKSEHSRFIDNYKSINYLAEGSSCKIYVARHKLTGSQHAVKYVMKSVNKLNLIEDKILNEIKIMDGLKHENIVNFKYAWVENHHEEWLAEQEDSYFNMIESNTVYSGDKSPYLFIAMEYCGKGSLDTWLKNNPETPENTLIEMMQQVVCGLAYLHSKNIIHRDIKPMNIFIDDENIVKIGDLGIARFMSDKNENVELKTLDKEKVINFEKYTQFSGTPGYMAPEQMKYYYNEKVDIWALGVVFLEVFCKNLSNHQIELARKGKFPSDLKMKNNRLMRLIKTMIEINTNERISANDLFMALHGLRYSSRLPNEKWLTKSDEKTPFPYRNDEITSFNQMANEEGLKGVTNIIDKFTDSLTEEEIGSLFKVLKEDKDQTIANIMPTGMEYMMSALKILQCAQTGQNLDTIDSMFAKMKIITDKFESSNKPNEN